MTMILDFPYKAEKNFLDKLVEKIEQAEESIRFLTPYLVLPNEVTNALIDAATRGVIVNIIITGKADKRIAYRAATRYAEKLSSYGIKVLRTDNFFMHAKVYIFDDKKVMFGTSNLDYRALFHHYETNFESKDKELVKDLISHFNDVAKRSYLLENKSLN
jgi:cardiolipin synthase